MPIVNLLNTHTWHQGKTYIDFEYDFRNKTMAQLTADWWIERTPWSTQISSQWIKASSYQYMYNYLPDLQQALQDANIITLKTRYYNWWVSSWYYCDGGVWVSNISSPAGGAKVFITWDYTAASVSSWNLIRYSYSAWTVPVWDYEITLIINKTTKQLSLNIPNFYTNTVTIPDEQIPSLDTYDLFDVTYWQSAYTRKVSIKTE